MCLCLCSPSTGVAFTTLPAFFRGPKDLNSGLHGCAARALQTGPTMEVLQLGNRPTEPSLHSKIQLLTICWDGFLVIFGLVVTGDPMAKISCEIPLTSLSWVQIREAASQGLISHYSPRLLHRTLFIHMTSQATFFT